MEWASLPISVAALILTLYFGVKLNTVTARVSAHAEQRIIETIVRRLENGSIKSADQVRGIISNIAAEYSISMPEDKQIEILLRRIAVRYEHDPEQHMRYLRVLEIVRREVAPKGLPLASIAATSRVVAFQLMSTTVLLFIIVMHYVTMRAARRSWPLSIALSIGELLVALVVFRVYRYGREKAAQCGDLRQNS
jgi:hypothetical protein